MTSPAQLRPVVITGLGPVTAFGVGIDPLWEAMVAGTSGIGRITRFDPAGFPCQVAAEVPDDFNIRKVVPKSYRKATKVMCRDIEFAVAGAAEAVNHAGLTTQGTDPDAEPTYASARFGCHIGAGLISADVDELAAALVTSRGAEGEVDLSHWGEAGMTNLTPLWLLKYLPNMLACHVTIVHNCHGPSNTITCCEASALLSLGESLRVIQRNAADACLTGGAEFKLNLMAFYRQICAKRLAETNGDIDPTQVVRPFDSAAKGTVLGEGGGIVVIEAEDTAKARGATALARISGFAATQSHCPDTVGLELNEAGESIADAIEAAVRSAGLTAEDIDAITPLGSGIASVDAAEANAIKHVFGDRARELPIITTIPNVGNCTAGNAAVALSVATRALQEQMLPARLNSGDTNGVDGAATEARAAELKHIVVSTTSQGGQNAAVVVSSV